MSEHNQLDDHNTVPEGYQPGSDADIHISSILFVGIIGSVLIIVIILLLKAFYYQTLEAERQRKLGAGIDVALADLQGKQLEQLGSYRWVNAREAKVGLPLAEAMQLVWQEQSAATSSTFEIYDWDHSPSDLHAVPGDLVMSRGTQAQTLGADSSHVIEYLPNDDPPAENTRAEDDVSGNESVNPDAVVETPAEEDHQGDGDAAGGHQ
jgi:hypothetical protein